MENKGYMSYPYHIPISPIDPSKLRYYNNSNYDKFFIILFINSKQMSILSTRAKSFPGNNMLDSCNRDNNNNRNINNNNNNDINNMNNMPPQYIFNNNDGVLSINIEHKHIYSAIFDKNKKFNRKIEFNRNEMDSSAVETGSYSNFIVDRNGRKIIKTDENIIENIRYPEIISEGNFF
jgi:hypothetical protein